MGEKFDRISCSFAPKLGVQRIWSVAQGIVIWCYFGQKSLVKAAVFEASKRGGKIACRMRDDGRVMLGGKAVLYTVSELFV